MLAAAGVQVFSPYISFLPSVFLSVFALQVPPVQPPLRVWGGRAGWASNAFVYFVSTKEKPMGLNLVVSTTAGAVRPLQECQQHLTHHGQHTGQ